MIVSVFLKGFWGRLETIIYLSQIALSIVSIWRKDVVVWVAVA